MIHIKNCINCNIIFEFKQDTKIYCSKKCKRQYFYRQNIELEKNRSKEWVENNKEYTNLRKKKYRKSELGKKIIKEYRLNNKGKIKAYNAAYKAFKINALLKTTDLEMIKQIYKNCPDGQHVDHIYPLRSDWVCGLHTPLNLQYLSPSENSIKGNKKNIKYHKEIFID